MNLVIFHSLLNRSLGVNQRLPVWRFCCLFHTQFLLHCDARTRKIRFFEQNVYFDHQNECTAPICLSKYTPPALRFVTNFLNTRRIEECSLLHQAICEILRTERKRKKRGCVSRLGGDLNLDPLQRQPSVLTTSSCHIH